MIAPGQRHWCLHREHCCSHPALWGGGKWHETGLHFQPCASDDGWRPWLCWLGTQHETAGTRRGFSWRDFNEEYLEKCGQSSTRQRIRGHARAGHSGKLLPPLGREEGALSREGAPNNSHDPEGLRLLPNWRGKKKREINAFPFSKSTWKPRELS